MKAMHVEAFGYMKYMMFANHARRNGREELAKLYEKTAQTERVEHFAEEAELARLVGNDIENLINAIEGEKYEVDWLYHDFAEQAAAARDAKAAARFTEIGHDEMEHRDAFQAALEKLEAELDAGVGLPMPDEISSYVVPWNSN